MLTGTSAQSSNGNAAAGSSPSQHRDSDAADQNEQPRFTANLKDQTQTDNDQLQNSATQAASSSTAGRVAAPQAQVRSNANGTSRPAGHEDKTPMAPATAVANAVPLLATPPVEITPVPALPVPCTSPAEQCEGNAGTPQAESTDAVGGTQTQSDSDHAARLTHVAKNGQETIPAQNAKAAAPALELSEDAAAQFDIPESSSTASVVGFSLPAGITPIASSLSSMTFAFTGSLPSMSYTGQSIANPAQSGKVSDSNLSSNLSRSAVTANAAGATGNNQTTSSSAPANASAHNASSTVLGNATVEHSQAQTAQAAPTAQGPASAAAPQIQAIVAQGTAHEAAPLRSSADTTSETTHASGRAAQPEINASAPTQGINTANVIQKMNETEMRVGMHSAEFGEISIRTSVSQQQMMAQISVDHGDLGKAISAHIPAMEAKLGGEFGIRAMVQVNQSGMSFSGERGASPQREQTRFSQTAQSEAAPALAETDSATPRIAAIAGTGYRLDIRA